MHNGQNLDSRAWQHAPKYGLFRAKPPFLKHSPLKKLIADFWGGILGGDRAEYRQSISSGGPHQQNWANWLRNALDDLNESAKYPNW